VTADESGCADEESLGGESGRKTKLAESWRADPEAETEEGTETSESGSGDKEVILPGSAWDEGEGESKVSLGRGDAADESFVFGDEVWVADGDKVAEAAGDAGIGEKTIGLVEVVAEGSVGNGVVWAGVVGAKDAVWEGLR